MKKHLLLRTAGADLAVCFLLLAVVNLACMGARKPWRDYSDKPFSSADWLAGDKIERGRMWSSMYRNKAVEVSSHESAVKTLGEPDFKKNIDNKDVWFYRIELGQGAEAMDLIPVTFDEKGHGSLGMSGKGSFGLLAREDKL